MRVHNRDWLIQLLSQNRLIHMRDGLGTFLHNTSDGWRIRGRDDIVVLLDKRIFDDLSEALFAAKSLKDRFLKQKDKPNARP